MQLKAHLFGVCALQYIAKIMTYPLNRYSMAEVGQNDNSLNETHINDH